MNEPKRPWKSRTVWINGLTTLAGVIGVVVGQEFIASNPAAVAIGAAVLGIVNVALRFVTDTAISIFEE